MFWRRRFALRHSAEICRFRNWFHSSLFTRDEAWRIAVTRQAAGHAAAKLIRGIDLSQRSRADLRYAE
jgi:hypothetical protein